MTECAHRWRRIGSHWVPSYSSWPNDGRRDVEVEYLDYICAVCKQLRSEERPYSARPIKGQTND